MFKEGDDVRDAGLAEFVQNQDVMLRSVFERADQQMYRRKRELKARTWVCHDERLCIGEKNSRRCKDEWLRNIFVNQEDPRGEILRSINTLPLDKCPSFKYYSIDEKEIYIIAFWIIW